MFMGDYFTRWRELKGQVGLPREVSTGKVHFVMLFGEIHLKSLLVKVDVSYDLRC